ncbi:pyridoxal phosphate-dependent aminotransferase [soil metagenome]
MFDFDTAIDRRGSHCAKWDMMRAVYGVAPEDGIAMWVADMDFAAPPAVNAALAAAARHGVHGYFGDDRAYKASITGWMAERHGWAVEPGWILTTHGLVAATALCVQVFSQPGDGVILFTPVYHAFHRVIGANARRIVEAPLVEDAGRYRMDLEALALRLTGRERMVILCSPHNPGGRVWEAGELRALAGFCGAHDLLLVSDEIHHDLVLGPARHVAMPLAAPDIAHRLVMLTATTKTFNIAGAHVGNVIIADPRLRARFQAGLLAAGSSPNHLGMLMATAAYEDGAGWLDALRPYLAENAKVFDQGVNAIPGLRSMPLEATYLAWVDFSGTGMDREAFTARVEKTARIAANHGTTFGAGGESFLRFNIAAPRARIEEAVRRLREAFAP